MTKIKPCSCAHAQQDEMHGKRNRVMNSLRPKAPGALVFRCTVCLAEHGDSGSNIKESK